MFLRMHPTGKAVLSLSEASQGGEAKLAGIVAEELGIPPEDVKVVHEDTDRFGEGHSYNTEPSDAVEEYVRITARRLRDKAQIVVASMLDASPDALRFENGRWTVEGGGPGGRQDPGGGGPHVRGLRASRGSRGVARRPDDLQGRGRAGRWIASGPVGRQSTLG